VKAPNRVLDKEMVSVHDWVQRATPRIFAMLPIVISAHAGAESRPGITRDLSKDGIFFYSNVTPKLHSNISLVLKVNGARIPCSGEVVRVENRIPGAAVGVAVMIQDDNRFLETEIEHLCSGLTESSLRPPMGPRTGPAGTSLEEVRETEIAL
jgi:hypothetical protein